MKTILRIIVILLVAALVAGGFALAVGNTSSATTGFNAEGGQPPAMTTGANGQSTQQMPSRPEGGFGDREGGASLGGLLGIFGTLAKLAGITVIVLLIEKGIGLLTNKKILRTA